VAARWRYLLGEVGLGLRRNLLMTVATVLTVTVSLALLGAGLLVQRQVDIARELFFSQVEVSIFLRDDISEAQRQTLESDLVGSGLVQEVLYESKQQAYAKYQRLFADQPDLVESVEPDFLPASFRVKLTDPEEYRAIETRFAGYPGVEDITDQREVLGRFFQIMDGFRNGAIVVALLQLVAGAALISNTIRITAFARREQTGIMKLVGATNWYIRLPFILEGVIAGVLGALTAGGLLLVAEATIVNRLREAVTFLPLVRTVDVVQTIPVLVLIGAGIAAIASFLAIRRHLAV
jgi:cell division transport system permease protein